jgi:hypothetical protein
MTPTSTAAGRRLSPLTLALCPAVLLAGFGFIPWVAANSRLLASIWGATATLLALLIALRRRVSQSGRTLRYTVAPRPVHYVQLMMHTSIYLYWGWYWREVYHYAPLIAAQILFVYSLDMIVSWWRHDEWILGFGPFPIVLSTNLFLWFRDDWFFLQFLMIATGVLCKQLVTWKRGGRRTHIFNPSAIGLSLFSLGLLLTHGTAISWGEEVAVSLGRPPYMYFWIFACGLVVQSLFSVTLMTLFAAATLFALNLAYTAATGVYYFVDSTIPIAVFLGLHLLVTDPATSPKSNIGKAIFGAAYGAAVFCLYWVLAKLGMPTFYDKLLCVPALNLAVPLLDRVGVTLQECFAASTQFMAGWSPRQSNYAHMSVWIALFASMAGTGLVGRHHPGASNEFWNRACIEGRNGACATWIRVLNIACTHGAGGSCLKLGFTLDEGRVVARNAEEASKDLARACDLKAPGGCAGLIALVRKEGPDVLATPCGRGDGESCFVLASLYYGGAGVTRDYARSASLFRQACDRGWPRGCGGLGECYKAGFGVESDAVQAIRYFEKACAGGVAASCFAAGSLYQAKDAVLAAHLFRQACDFSIHAQIARTAYFVAGSEQPAESAPAFCAQQ